MEAFDFRSDTVTKPTPEMRRAMMEAEVGDDVYGDDPTVNRLEALAARTVGKEAAVFVPTGTMGNQVAIMSHTRAGEELIAGSLCHIIRYEAGGAARLAGLSLALVPGYLESAAAIAPLVRADDVHFPQSRLVCLENALGDGRVVPLEEMKAIHAAAKQHGLLVHLDGARLFNAAEALGTTAAALAGCTDSVTFCLSKGLCAPVGSLVCGSAEFARRARRARKLLGGGMRQAGVLAACGLIALERMTARLAEDHENARHLGRLLAELPEVEVRSEALQINMVFWRPASRDFDMPAFLAFMAARGFTLGGYAGDWHRLVTHRDADRTAVEAFVRALKEYLAARNKNNG